METKSYNIDFGGNCMALVEVTGSEIKVVAAMDGYGNSIDIADIIIEAR